ncbi:MAG: archaemetzincin family Zn-dependent metalloprotease [Ignavibacteriae bacterium]|nr:archaemetzincin family Zn-dependent metalloprotease [Ignavibacteriota bacterium]
MINAIYILNASTLQEQDLDRIVHTVKTIFRVPVFVKQVGLDFGSAFDGSRGQWNSTVLLSQIITNSVGDDEKLVAIVDVDLFIPVLTFVFGEAQFKGTAAIVSTHRLANQFYGLEEDKQQLLQRLEKEIVHELGHTFGLYHCRQFECVMRSSTYVGEIDLKQVFPCQDCQRLLLKNFS